MPINLANYYDRFDAADNYEQHLFRAGNVLQSSELNEIQSAARHRLQRVTDALLKEGDVLSGAAINVDLATGATTVAGGALYLRGAVRGVPAGTLTVPTSGNVMVGVYLTTTIITELEDPDLRDPAVSFRNYQDPGAARLRIDAAWGHDSDNQSGDFYPVYRVEDGLVIGNTPPPEVDAMAQIVARYDRQSAGGFYVSSGLQVTRLADHPDGAQVYSMAAGVARVGGEEIVRQHARRIVFDAQPDTRDIENEPHLALGGTERVTTDYHPIHAIEDLSVVRQETTTLTHGVSGSMDVIYAPDGVTQRTSVINIVSCVQGETTYVKGADYQLTAGKVDWSLAPTAPEGEPGVGNTYTCVFQYRDTYVPATEDYDDTGFTVTGAVVGTEILASYAWALPRYDLICLSQRGDIQAVVGVSATQAPRMPAVPPGWLGVAMIRQNWDATTEVVNNATRMVPMNEMVRMGQNIDTLFALVAEERLALNLSQRDLPAEKGVFADPFLNDNLRDQGLTQTAAILDGDLTLGVVATVHAQSLTAPATIVPGPSVVIINQPLRTGTKKINPYDSFMPLPAGATLSPAIDEWTTTNINWLSPVTKVFNERDLTRGPTGRGGGMGSVVKRIWETSEEETLSTTTSSDAWLRPIEITFHLTGFGPGEALNEVFFDGLPVSFTELLP